MADRLPRDRGRCKPSRLPRGPNGRALCRQCSTEVSPPRLTFCSDACVRAWKEVRNPTYQRRRVFERDAGVCRECGLDVGRLQRRVEALRARIKLALWRAPEGRVPQLRRRLSAVDVRLRAGGFIPGQSLWEMDHVVPVVEGGGACDLSNLRLLCRPCHVRVTRELRRRLAAARRAQEVEGG